jgi:hypothetical protein
MTTLVLEAEPAVVDLTISNKELAIDLADGRRIMIPLEWYPRLVHGTPQERKNWQLLGDGYAIEWPDLDEHIGIEGLLAGRRSSESKKSFDRWLAARKTKAPSGRRGMLRGEHAPRSRLKKAPFQSKHSGKGRGSRPAVGRR